MSDRLLKVTEVAERLGVSRDWAYRLCERGDIAVTRVGARTVRVTEESLAKFIADNTSVTRKSRKGAAA